MKNKTIKKFLVKLKLAFSNPLTIRDVSLGLLINAIYDISNNGIRMTNLIVFILSFYAIIEANYKIKKDK